MDGNRFPTVRNYSFNDLEFGRLIKIRQLRLLTFLFVEVIMWII